MGRRKVVTTVSIDPDVYNKGREEGYNFSKLLQNAIIGKNDPFREIQILKDEIHYHEEQIAKLEVELKIVERVAKQTRNAIIERVIDKYIPTYRDIGSLPDAVMDRLCDNLNMEVKQVIEVLDEYV